MNRAILFILLSGLLSLASQAQASEFSVLYHAAVEARDSLETFVRDPNKRDQAQLKRVQESADAVDVALSMVKAPVGREFGIQLLLEGWEETKKFRQKVISLVLSGKEDQALALMTGEQQQNLFKALVFFDQLDQQSMN